MEHLVPFGDRGQGKAALDVLTMWRDEDWTLWLEVLAREAFNCYSPVCTGVVKDHVQYLGWEVEEVGRIGGLWAFEEG